MSGKAEAAAPQQSEATESNAAIVGDIFPGFGEGGGEASESQSKSGESTTQPVESEETEQTEEQSEEQAEAEPSGDDPVSLLRLDALFNESALKTPEGISKARETVLNARKALREMQHSINDAHIAAKKHEQKSKAARDEARRVLKSAEAIQSRVAADVDILANSNDADEILAAMGRLGRRDGNRLYEEITAGIVGKRAQKKSEPDPKVKELEDKIAAFERREQERATMEARRNWIARLDADFNAQKDSFPGIAHVIDQGKAQQLVQYVEELAWSHHKATGEWPSNAMLLGHVEGELKGLVPERPAAQTVAPQKNGRLPGRGVSPARAASHTPAKRLEEMSDAERDEQLQRDAPAILASLGIEL